MCNLTVCNQLKSYKCFFFLEKKKKGLIILYLLQKVFYWIISMNKCKENFSDLVCDKDQTFFQVMECHQKV